jgi:hypothetical protein
VPGSKRNWRAVGFEMLVETKESGAEGKASKVEGKESTAGEGIEDASDASTRELSDALPRELIDTKTLGEDEIACGEWRATTGVTFLTTESLLDDAAYNEMWIDKFDKAREDEMMGDTLGGDVDAFDEGTALGVSQIQAHCFISNAGDCCPYIAIYSYCEGRITGCRLSARNYSRNMARKTDTLFYHRKTSATTETSRERVVRTFPIPTARDTWTSSGRGAACDGKAGAGL